MNIDHNGDLIVRLAHELGVALEMTFTAAEMRELWSDALEALQDAKGHLVVNGLGVPPVVDNVLAAAERDITSKAL